MVEQLKTKLEFEVGYSDRTRGGLQYGINLNLSTLKNKVTEIIVPAALVGAGAPQIMTVLLVLNKDVLYGIFMDTKLMESILQQGK
jgi:hypothetical protein